MIIITVHHIHYAVAPRMCAHRKMRESWECSSYEAAAVHTLSEAFVFRMVMQRYVYIYGAVWMCVCGLCVRMSVVRLYTYGHRKGISTSQPYVVYMYMVNVFVCEIPTERPTATAPWDVFYPDERKGSAPRLWACGKPRAPRGLLRARRSNRFVSLARAVYSYFSKTILSREWAFECKLYTLVLLFLLV